jgi:cyanophycin synthetase
MAICPSSKGDWLLRIEQAEKVPLTMGGLAPFQIANALAASLAAFAQGVGIEHIRQALHTFQASTKQTPGRMNLFNLGQASMPWWTMPTTPPATKPWGVCDATGPVAALVWLVAPETGAMTTSLPWVNWRCRCLMKSSSKKTTTPGVAPGEMPLKWITRGIEEVANQVSYRTILDETDRHRNRPG